MAYTVMAYILMAYIVMAFIAMAYIVTAYIVMADIVMAYVVMADIVMAAGRAGRAGLQRRDGAARRGAVRARRRRRRAAQGRRQQGLQEFVWACAFEQIQGASLKSYPHLLKSRSHEGVPGISGKTQKEGQEDQGKIKELGGDPWGV